VGSLLAASAVRPPSARCAVTRGTRDSAPTAAARLHCRLCDSDRLLSVLDLGATPPCEKFLTPGELDLPEPTFPLHLRLKHGRFSPGTRIPIHDPKRVAKDRPDVVLALSWDLEAELTDQLSYIAEWGGQLVFPPTLQRPAMSVSNGNGAKLA
jgi:C-methyltransferase C-terminal domain/Putative zinc binding domain